MSFRVAKPALLHVFLWAIAVSYGVSDWSQYREKFPPGSALWKMHLRGGIEAPFQYRIGNWVLVGWLNRLRIQPYNALTLIDVLCLVGALWTLLQIATEIDGFQKVSARTRWLTIAGVLFLTEYYLGWGHWFQSTGTLPSVLFVVLSLALVDGKIMHNRLSASLLLIGLSVIQGFIRADVAVVLHAGFFLAVVFSGKTSIPLGRVRQAATSFLAALLAGCVQLYLMFVLFPNAKYGASGPVRFISNLHPQMWLIMLLALLPFWLLLGLTARKRYRPDAVTVMLLTSALLYLPLWATVGLLDEVRIFLPFAFALIPATVLALMGLLPETRAEN